MSTAVTSGGPPSFVSHEAGTVHSGTITRSTFTDASSFFPKLNLFKL